MSEMLTEASLLKALEIVQDPDLGQSIAALGMIKDVKIAEEGAVLAFTCELTTPACPVKEQIEKEIRAAVQRAFPAVRTLDLTMTGKVRGAPGFSPAAEHPVPQVKNVVAIGGGKGGVGKSTLAVNLALALQRLGARAALLDLDIYHPSVPLLMGLRGRPKLEGETRIRPLVAFGIEVMSMGLLVEPRQAMIWRGPVLNGIILQFLRDVLWSEADYLLVDLPPGTGEIPLALAQGCPVAGAVLVTTPQEASLSCMHREKGLFEQIRVPVLGLLENMAGSRGVEGAPAQDPFGGPGAAGTAGEMKVPLLGSVPFASDVARGGDAGEPIIAARPASGVARAILAAAERLAAQVSIRSMTPAPAPSPSASPVAAEAG